MLKPDTLDLHRPLGRTLKKTITRCPQCHRECDGEVRLVSGAPDKVYMHRTCPEHGPQTSLLSSDACFYWLAQGDPNNSCGSGCACRANDGGVAGTLGRNARSPAENVPDPFEVLSTCLALIELVPSCNLSCPVCYADSPHKEHSSSSLPTLTNLKERVQGITDRKGKIDILQLSGGEPTIHPDFFPFLQWAQENPGIDYVLLNTNGVRLLEDSFLEQLGRYWKKGKFQIYLQFDGVQEEGQTALRGVDLRDMRKKVIERLGRSSIPVTLAMTVTKDTLKGLWDTVQFGLGYEHIRGVSFQPLFGSGRIPGHLQKNLNAADIVNGLIEQSSRSLQAEDFTPLPCGDPNCAIIGYLLKTPLGVRSIREFIDFSKVQGFLHDKVRYDLNDLSMCGCENQPLGEMLRRLEMDERHAFRLFIKPFMDSGTWDQDRIDRCCTHVIRPDGKLDSFCRYYSTQA